MSEAVGSDNGRGKYIRRAVVVCWEEKSSRISGKETSIEETGKMTTILKTATGSFKGKKGDGVTQYLGVQYARLRDQLAPPEMVREYGDGTVDASMYG